MGMIKNFVDWCIRRHAQNTATTETKTVTTVKWVNTHLTMAEIRVQETGKIVSVYVGNLVRVSDEGRNIDGRIASIGLTGVEVRFYTEAGEPAIKHFLYDNLVLKLKL